MPSENGLEAAKSAQEFVKYLVVLAVGALGFSLASLTATPKCLWLVRGLTVVSSLLLALSVLCGILAYGTLISQIFEDKIDLDLSRLRWQSIPQWISFFLGVVIQGIAILIREFR
jgi:hypothetical protein